MNTSIDKLHSEAHVAIKYPQELRLAVEKSVEAWKNFCALPENIRTQFPYLEKEPTGGGYELKKTSGTTLDIKEDFQFNHDGEEWIHQQTERINNSTVSEFVKSLSDLVNIMQPTVVNFAKELEQIYSINDFGKDIEANSKSWTVRFLHYFGGVHAEEEIAKPHADKSGFTLHLYESHPGLQYLDFENNWKDMIISKGETVIIPGLRGQYASGGKLRATCHRVIATEETAMEGRFSAVAFIHPNDGIPKFDKARLGRQQDLAPGFNYEMPFEEFSTFFK